MKTDVKQGVNRTVVAMALACLASMAPSLAHAGPTIWGNNASFGNVTLEAFDAATGLLIPGQQFLAPNLTARNDNGRGIAVLGNTIYYTTANSGNIYVTDAITHVDKGILVNTGFNGIANVATDGKYIYANNYIDTSGVINKYDTSGNLVGTVVVGPGHDGRDGFEVQNNPNLDSGNLTFISNRGDANSPYDVYRSDGSLLVAGFINPAADGFGNRQTGIAYDGTSYYVSQIDSNELLHYSGTGAFLGIIDLSTNPPPASGQRLLEDLSAVGNTTENPPPTGNVPEPGSFALLGLGMLTLATIRRNKMN